MKQIHALLLEGKGEAARHRLAELLAQAPEKAAAAAEPIAKILAGCYEQFNVQTVHDFCRDMELELPPVVAGRVRQALGPKLQRTADWTRMLRDVTRERLVRECRDTIMQRDLKKAAICAATLLERADGASELDDTSILLARGLATLTRDRDSCLTVIGYLMKANGQARLAAPIVADQFTQMSKDFRDVAFDHVGGEWSQQLSDAMLGYRAYLPGPTEAGEPDPEQVEKFYEEAHACLRAGLARRNREDFIDAIMTLMEYCPADPAMTRNAAGLEERMFLKLGPRARLAAVRGLQRLGEIDLLRKTINHIAKESGAERLRLLTAIMGGLRHPEFYPYLHNALAKADNRRDEARLIEAIGRIGNPEAARMLLARLAQAVKRIHAPGLAKAIPIYSTETTARELSPEERTTLLLTALGRIARMKGVDPKFRNELVRSVIELLDKEDRKLAFHAASELFSVRLGELSPELKQWAAGKAVEAMWGQPLSQPDAVSVNGWREPMVGTLLRLGAEALPATLAMAEKYATRYCGAMSALANALAETGDERAVPVLETMLRTAFLQPDDAPQSKLLEEKRVDAVTGETRGLDRDDVIHTILFALGKVGGEAGLKVILECVDQVQAGRLQPPGQQTINFLVDVAMKYTERAKRMAAAQAAEVDEKTLKQALSQARGGLLVRKATQIAAIAQLGQLRRLEGVPVLFDVLGEKDHMLASAAHTALAQFLSPLPGEKGYGEFLDSLLEQAADLKGGRLMDRFLDYINRELPKNPPYSQWLDQRLEIMIEDGELAHRIRGAARRPKDVLERMKSETGSSAAAEPAERNVYIDDDRMSRQSGLDQKRLYFEARREWARKGKVGPPPEPPSGLTLD